MLNCIRLSGLAPEGGVDDGQDLLGYVLVLALFSVMVFLAVDIIIAIIEPRADLK